jgi:hypothetical protein
MSASALIISARDLFICTADAVHLVTTQEQGECDVWTIETTPVLYTRDLFRR